MHTVPTQVNAYLTFVSLLSRDEWGLTRERSKLMMIMMMMVTLHIHYPYHDSLNPHPRPHSLQSSREFEKPPISNQFFPSMFSSSNLPTCCYIHIYESQKGVSLLSLALCVHINPTDLMGPQLPFAYDA
jgi:hypothetical protein